MTLNEIKAAAAAYVKRETTDLTVNGVDLGLIALNQVRLNAELQHNFEFSRKLLSVDVNGASGGSLEDVVEVGLDMEEGDPPIAIKSILDVGLANTSGTFIPAAWTTLQDSFSEQREENRFTNIRYPTDGQAVSGPFGQRRFLFSGNMVYYYPPPTESVTFSLLIHAYTFTKDWVDADLLPSATVGTPWTTQGSQYLLWGTIIHLNNIFKEFVFRQEGNLAPPEAMRDQGLSNLVSWDIFKYEQNRRHSR
jgi:hypothetical protein